MSYQTTKKAVMNSIGAFPCSDYDELNCDGTIESINAVRNTRIYNKGFRDQYTRTSWIAIGVCSNCNTQFQYDVEYCNKCKMWHLDGSDCNCNDKKR